MFPVCEGSEWSSTLTVNKRATLLSEHKGRERQREGESKAISKGIRPKPQDISDLEGEWVKQGGGRKERRKRNGEEG